MPLDASSVSLPIATPVPEPPIVHVSFADLASNVVSAPLLTVSTSFEALTPVELPAVNLVIVPLPSVFTVPSSDSEH